MYGYFTILGVSLMLFCRLWGALTFQNLLMYAKAPWEHSGYLRAPQGARSDRNVAWLRKAPFICIFFLSFLADLKPKYYHFVSQVHLKRRLFGFCALQTSKGAFQHVFYTPGAITIQMLYMQYNIIGQAPFKRMICKKHISTTIKYYTTSRSQLTRGGLLDRVTFFDFFF